MTMPDPRIDLDAEDRAVRLIEQFATRGIRLSRRQATELASVVDRLHRLKAIVRDGAEGSEPRQP